MNIMELKYEFEFSEDLFNGANPKIIEVLNTRIDSVYCEHGKYYITEYTKNNIDDDTHNIYCIDDFNSVEKYLLLVELMRNHKINLFCGILNTYKDINVYDKNNLLLNMACKRCQYHVISRLIDTGVDVTFNNNIAIKIVSFYLFKDYYGYKKEYMIMILELLLSNGADIHVDNEYVLCCASHDIVIFKYLLQLGYKYDISSRDDYCLQRCINHYYNQITNSLDKNNGRGSVRETGERFLPDINGNLFIVSDIIKDLLNMGANVNCNNGYIINDIVIYGNKYIIELFIEYGADLNLLTNDSLCRTISQMNCDIIKLLVGNGVKFNKLNDEPITNIKKINTANLLLEIGLTLEKIFDII
ncbi:putative ankyrin repeat protein [Cotonvirus japonicus]|uniref:Ankyrin repeat protein n=1 Tax=Cotonvirus japonicus TaxID=2811091 RepID=A0ABM7NU38_9VIRU|nr:putative ankyrin repeat protein [Cotonvirus japonicus]BCS83700.1 putative ankyrin repeat protein [Cotonvirus japonicus]